MSRMNQVFMLKLKKNPLFLEHYSANSVRHLGQSSDQNLIFPKMTRLFSPILALAIACGVLTSCSSLQTSSTQESPTPSKTTAKNKSATSKALAKLDPRGLKNLRFQPEKLRGLKFPSFRKKTPPIVEVKKDADFKKPVIASKSKKRTYKPRKSSKKKKAFVPKDFDESDLMVDGQLPSYGVLPSLNPSSSAAIDTMDDVGELPDEVAALPSIPPVPTLPKVSPPPTAPYTSSVPAYLKPVRPVPNAPAGQ